MISKCYYKVAFWRATVCLVFMQFLLFIFIFQTDVTPELDYSTRNNGNLSAKHFSPSQHNCGQEEAFSFIPKATACKWAQTEFLIVFGTLSVDMDGQQRRRALQRATCWTFPGVATRVNDYNGSMLVLYTLACHPAHGFAFSESLRLEAEQWHDILTFPINEGRTTSNKQIGHPGHWGNEAAVGMGKKVYFWLQLALCAFPLAVHVGKADDDMFMKVPQYLADLRRLPQQKTYWGPYAGGMMLKNKQKELVDVKFMVGYCVALARDVVEAVVRYEPLQRIISLPYTNENELDFLILNVNFDDIMVGRILKETGYPAIFVADQPGCRFHNCGDDGVSRNISENTVVAHHISEDEYHTFMGYFMRNGINIQNTTITKSSPTFYWVECPFK